MTSFQLSYRMPVVYFFTSNILQEEYSAGNYIRRGNLLLKRNRPLQKGRFRFFFSGEKFDSETDFNEYPCRYEVEYPDFYKNVVDSRDPLVHVWVDESGHSLTIARDAFGKIPLYYHFVPGSFLAFSDDVNDLLRLDIVRQNIKVNLPVVSSYLSDADINTPYRSLTFFDSIFTILPGHYVKFESRAQESKRYLFFSSNRWAGLSDVNEYGDLFREKLTQSIARNVSSLTKVAAHLSGGLDSSSIVSLLCKEFPELDVHTFFVGTADHVKIDKDKERFSDRYFVEEVQKFTGVPVHVCYPPQSAVDLAIKYTNNTAQPLNMKNASLARLMVGSIREKGLGVLLSGHGGDNFVGYGNTYLDELWQNENWVDFRKSIFNLAGEDRFLKAKLQYGASKFPQLLLGAQVENRIIQYIKSGNWDLAFKALLIVSTQLGLSPKEILGRLGKKGWRKISDRFKEKGGTILNKELLSLNHQPDAEMVTDNLPLEERGKYLNIFVNQNVRHLEENYHWARAEGVEYRYPFFDQDLYEVSLSVPPKLVFDNGRGRGHMRAGLKGVLPEAVRNRTGKYNSGSEALIDSATQLLQSEARDFLTDSGSVWQYADKISFWNNVKILSRNEADVKSVRVAFQVYRVIYFSIWLDQYITRK